MQVGVEVEALVPGMEHGGADDEAFGIGGDGLGGDSEQDREPNAAVLEGDPGDRRRQGEVDPLAAAPPGREKRRMDGRFSVSRLRDPIGCGPVLTRLARTTPRLHGNVFRRINGSADRAPCASPGWPMSCNPLGGRANPVPAWESSG